jgi:hypothetical protein
MSGLTRKKIKVRSKSGKTYQRSMLVRATDTIKRHSGKLLAGAALVGGAALAYHNRDKIKPHMTRAALSAHGQNALKAANKWRMTEGANMARRVVEGVGTALATHYIAKAAGAFGERAGKRIGGKRGKEFGRVAGEALGAATVGHAVEGHIGRAATETGKALRRKNVIRAKRK